MKRTLDQLIMDTESHLQTLKEKRAMRDSHTGDERSRAIGGAIRALKRLGRAGVEEQKCSELLAELETRVTEAIDTPTLFEAVPK